MVWPFAKKSKAAPLVPIQFGVAKSNHIDLLRAEGLEILSSTADVKPSSTENAAALLLPAVLTYVQTIMNNGRLLNALDPALVLVVGYRNRLQHELPLQAEALSTSPIGGPKAFLIRIVTTSIQELFAAAKQLLVDESLIERLGSQAGVDLRGSDSMGSLMNRAVFGSMLLLYFHELSHVVRNHFGFLASRPALRSHALSGEHARRVIEVDADFFGSLLLAHFAPLLAPPRASGSGAHTDRQYLWCLVVSFILFAAMSQNEHGYDVDLDDRTREYYSPLIRCHTLPIAFSTILGLDLARADDMLVGFYRVLSTCNTGSPLLTRYSKWNALYNQDLLNWRETELERVSAQDAGHFTRFLL
jgi:hypothetical protein